MHATVMATSAPELSITDLADVLAALKEVTKPYQLGIQLKIELTKLDEIEKDHHRDVDRQKTEVIKYWLRNSPDASWTTLANAVERMGGQANLTERLREKEQIGKKPLSIPQMQRIPHRNSIYLHENEYRELTQSYGMPKRKRKLKQTNSSTISRSTCVKRNILLLGKMGHGKSTLGNRMLDDDGCFKINDEQSPQTTEGSAVLKSVSQLKNYEIKVYDHSGLFEGGSLSGAPFYDGPKHMNLVIFVIKHGHNFDHNEIKSLISTSQISRISALVLTHCERLSEEEREEMIEQFNQDHPSVTELMGKGIFAVGFPDSSHVDAGSELSDTVENDKKKLRQLIYSCDERVNVDSISAIQGPRTKKPKKTCHELHSFLHSQGKDYDHKQQTQRRRQSSCPPTL